MHSVFSLIKKNSLWLFALALCITTLLMLWPFVPNNDGWIYKDKVEHVLVFAVLTCIGCMAYTQWPTRVMLGLIVYGAAIEYLQQALTSTRLASPADWLADCVGVAIGFILYRYVNKQYAL